MANLKDYMYKRAAMGSGPGPKPAAKPAANRNDSNVVQKWNKRLEDKMEQGRNTVIKNLKTQDANAKVKRDKLKKNIESTQQKIADKVTKWLDPGW